MHFTFYNYIFIYAHTFLLLFLKTSSVEFWHKVENAYKVNMSALAKTAAEQMQGLY